ncbi:hypothetical protein B5F74_11255 [Collinsella sp. An271]|nr:hypothetical protein B5F74_11255 [Collinsella sp. An271]
MLPCPFDGSRGINQIQGAPKAKPAICGEQPRSALRAQAIAALAGTEGETFKIDPLRQEVYHGR